MPFILDGLDSEEYDRNYSDRTLLKRISGYFRPHRRRMITAATMLTLNSVFGTAGTILIAKALDFIKAGATPASILFLSLGVTFLGCSPGASTMFGRWLRPG